MLITLKNSNTTLVKVKYFYICFFYTCFFNSNTTLVKVKCKTKIGFGSELKEFKYNTC